jgi:hypothetical protein
MTLVHIDADELARLRADRAALQGVVVRLTEELATLRKITDNYDAEADAVADLAVERWRLIQTLEARCASLQRQLLDLAARP